MDIDINFKAGVFAGFGLVAAGHPFDTLKTWAQNPPQTKPKINPITLYKGAIYPLIGHAFYNASLFGFHNYYRNRFTDNTFKGNLIAGSMAGVTSSVFSNVIDLYKIRSQRNIKPFWCHPFKGLYATMFRQSISSAMYFATYNHFRQQYIPYISDSKFICGGIAGVSCWSISYWIDTVKTRVQCDMTFTEAINKGQLWRGFGWCIVRAFIANASAFYCYEYAISNFSSKT